MHTTQAHLNPSTESLHEASHALVAAAMGIREISVITSSGKFCTSLKQGELWAQLVSSFAGCIGDEIICGLSDGMCRLRSTSDRTIRASMQSEVPKDLDWTKLCECAENLARSLLDSLRPEVIEFASALEPFRIARKNFPPEMVERLPSIQKARSIGKQ